MRDPKAHLSRRGFLAAGLQLLAAQAAVAGEHQHIVPTSTHAHISPVANAVDPELLARAIQAPVKTLQGLDPAGFLRNFDYGVATRLPDGRTLREYTMVAEDRDLEVAPGIFFPAWTYNGSVPGPSLRCTEGDRLRITLENRSVSEHTLHFHGSHPADMDGVVELVKPGERRVYEFDATPAGLHLYHCHVPPVALHLSRGLYGAFIVDSRRARPTPRTELVVVAAGWDLDFDGRNELYVINGGANYFRDNPIEIRVGEPVRLYFVNMLEHDPINSLHLHAAFFRSFRTTSLDEVGEYTDLITLCQADRRIVEFSYEHPGLFMFHAHQNRFAELGWMAHFKVVA